MHASSFARDKRAAAPAPRRASFRLRSLQPVNLGIILSALALLFVGASVSGPPTTRAAASVQVAGATSPPAVRTWRDTLNGANGTAEIGPWHPNPDGWYDPTRGQAEVTQDIKLAQSIGVKAIRFDFPWIFIEPTQGTYDFARADYIVNSLNAAGITPEPVVAYTPCWANTSCNATLAPTPAQFSSFVTALTGHFKGRIHYLEMWNEPDHGHYWNSGTAAYYSDVLIPGYQAVKAVDPTIQVIYPGLSNAGDSVATAFWQGAVTAGAQGDFDAFAVHDYANTVGSTVNTAHSFLNGIGRSSVPVIVGETGMSNLSSKGGSDAGQVSLVDQMFSSAASIVNWYDLRDDDIWDPTGTSILSTTAGYGLFTRSGDLTTPGTPAAKASATEFARLAGSAGPPAPSPSPSSAPTPTPAPVPSPTPTAVPPPLPVATGGLHVSGNHLVDASGGTVTLHGADMSGTEFVCAQGWSSDPFGGQPEDSSQTFAAMRSWNINVVRVPLNKDCWLGINGVKMPAGTYQAAVTKLVGDLRAAGFYVIVDLHWSAPAGQLAASQNPAPDEDHSPSFWKSVAATFASDTGVIYDLYNEPFFYWIAPGGPDENTCLWNGCTLTQYETGGTPFTITANWRSAGFNELIGDIRSAGAQNVIMAGGTNWARDLSGWLAHKPADSNVVASWHSYPSANPSLVSECAAQWCWDQVIAPLAAKVPVIVGETGDSAAGPETYLPGFLPYASSHGLNVVAWTWNAWTNPDDVLVTNMQTGAPTAGEGVVYKSWLAGQSIAPAPSPSPSPSPTPSPSPSPTPSPSTSLLPGTASRSDGPRRCR